METNEGKNEGIKRIYRGEIAAKKGTTNRQFNNSSTRAIQCIDNLMKDVCLRVFMCFCV